MDDRLSCEKYPESLSGKAGPRDMFPTQKQKILSFYEKQAVLSGSLLKLIAVATMLIDHTAAALLSENPVFLFQIAGRPITLYLIMRLIGRIAFPVYAFLLTEGFVHTRNRKRYGMELFVFALLSELPWNLLHANALLYPGQNVMFTLFFGYLGLCVCEKYKKDGAKAFLLLVCLVFVSAFARCDYGAKGFVLILILYLLREQKPLRTVCGVGILASGINTLGVAVGFAIPLFYNGKRGFINSKVLKYCFYAIYPVHLLLLWVIKRRMLGL